MGQRVRIPKKWFIDDSHYPNLVFEQLGKDIVSFEKYYLAQKTPEIANIESEELEIDGTILYEKIFEIDFPSNITLFLPLNFYMKFNLEWKLVHHEEGKVFLDGTPVEIIWSNKYNDFKHIMILDRNASYWFYQKAIDERLDIEFKDYDEYDIDFTIKTEIQYKIHDPSKIKLITPTNLPEKIGRKI